MKIAYIWIIGVLFIRMKINFNDYMTFNTTMMFEIKFISNVVLLYGIFRDKCIAPGVVLVKLILCSPM